MQSIYTSYICKRCGKEFVLLTEEQNNMPAGKYLACPYCGSKHIVKEDEADGVKDCMRERHYVRVKGSALIQR